MSAASLLCVTLLSGPAGKLQGFPRTFGHETGKVQQMYVVGTHICGAFSQPAIQVLLTNSLASFQSQQANMRPLWSLVVFCVLAFAASVTLRLLIDRFINARRRILQPMLDASNPEGSKTKKNKPQNRQVQRHWPDNIASMQVSGNLVCTKKKEKKRNK